MGLLLVAFFLVSCQIQGQPQDGLTLNTFPNQPGLTEVSWDQVEFDSSIWRKTEERRRLVESLNNSLAYLKTNSASEAYKIPKHPEFTLAKVRRTIQQFLNLLQTETNPISFEALLRERFKVFRSAGVERDGISRATGYFTAKDKASLTRTTECSYPLYGTPVSKQSRKDIEGVDGKGLNSPLSGQEVMFMCDRWQAYLVHVQGSAVLEAGGRDYSLSYAGSNERPYQSMGKLLFNAGKLPAEEIGQVTMDMVVKFFEQNPLERDPFLSQNEKFIFFRKSTGAVQPTGSIGVPVTADRSIATDKKVFPPGALAIVQPCCGGSQDWQSLFVLDQDTGSAIVGPGRFDLYTGIGKDAAERAGNVVKGNAYLHYIMTK